MLNAIACLLLCASTPFAADLKVRAAGWSSDNQRVLLVHELGWQERQASNGKVLRSGDFRESPIMDAAISADGKYVAVSWSYASQDTVRVFKWGTSKPLFELPSAYVLKMFWWNEKLVVSTDSEAGVWMSSIDGKRVDVCQSSLGVCAKGAQLVCNIDRRCWGRPDADLFVCVAPPIRTFEIRSRKRSGKIETEVDTSLEPAERILSFEGLDQSARVFFFSVTREEKIIRGALSLSNRKVSRESYDPKRAMPSTDPDSTSFMSVAIDASGAPVSFEPVIDITCPYPDKVSTNAAGHTLSWQRGAMGYLLDRPSTER